MTKTLILSETRFTYDLRTKLNSVFGLGFDKISQCEKNGYQIFISRMFIEAEAIYLKFEKTSISIRTDISIGIKKKDISLWKKIPLKNGRYINKTLSKKIRKFFKIEDEDSFFIKVPVFVQQKNVRLNSYLTVITEHHIIL